MHPSLKNLLKFSEFIAKFRMVERTLYLERLKRNENDAEHCCMLALTAWYVVSSKKLDLDIEKVILYALAHDLVETYAGDTDAFSTDENAHATKEAREHEALLRIQREFPEFPELIIAINAFEARENKEARFVYALDKIQPTLAVYLDKGASWRKQGITLEQVISRKKDVIEKNDPTVFNYFNQLIALLKKEEMELFNTRDFV